MASKLSSLISALVSKATPVDADKLPILNSADSDNFNWLSFSSLKTYLSGLYVAIGADAADLTSGVATDGHVLTADGLGGAGWEAVPSGDLASAVSAAEIDVSAGAVFTKTISGTTTFTVANVPASGTVASFVLLLTNGGSATVNWWSGMQWAGGTAPTLTASGVDALGFLTFDGGTIWMGFVLGQDVKAP